MYKCCMCEGKGKASYFDLLDFKDLPPGEYDSNDPSFPWKEGVCPDCKGLGWTTYDEYSWQRLQASKLLMSN